MGEKSKSGRDGIFECYTFWAMWCQTRKGKIIWTDRVKNEVNINIFTAIVDLSRFNNSCLKSPASTLVDLTFQSRALRSFNLNQLRNLSL